MLAALRKLFDEQAKTDDPDLPSTPSVRIEYTTEIYFGPLS